MIQDLTHLQCSSGDTDSPKFCSLQELGLFLLSDPLKRPPNLNKITYLNLPNKRFPFSQWLRLHCQNKNNKCTTSFENQTFEKLDLFSNEQLFSFVLYILSPLPIIKLHCHNKLYDHGLGNKQKQKQKQNLKYHKKVPTSMCVPCQYFVSTFC